MQISRPVWALDYVELMGSVQHFGSLWIKMLRWAPYLFMFCFLYGSSILAWTIHGGKFVRSCGIITDIALWKIDMKNCGRTCSQSLVFICFFFFISSQVLPAGEWHDPENPGRIGSQGTLVFHMACRFFEDRAHAIVVYIYEKSRYVNDEVSSLDILIVYSVAVCCSLERKILYQDMLSAQRDFCFYVQYHLHIIPSF